MSQSGRTCRRRERDGIAADEALELEMSRDEVRVRVNGAIVRTLRGADADAVRDAESDPERLGRVLARVAGIAKRSRSR